MVTFIFLTNINIKYFSIRIINKEINNSYNYNDNNSFLIIIIYF